jgi:hypothetical protein
MIKRIQPCIGDVWDYFQGGRYTVVDLIRHFETDQVFVVCENSSEKRIWPRDTWFHLVPYHGPDAPSGTMVRPFTLVQIGLRPRGLDDADQFVLESL